MKELHFFVIKTELYKKYLINLQMSLGCLVVEKAETVQIFTFCAGDAEIIIETLEEVDCKLIKEIDLKEGR